MTLWQLYCLTLLTYRLTHKKQIVEPIIIRNSIKKSYICKYNTLVCYIVVHFPTFDLAWRAWGCLLIHSFSLPNSAFVFDISDCNSRSLAYFEYNINDIIINSFILSFIHKYIQTYMHIYIPIYIHTYIRTYIKYTWYPNVHLQTNTPLLQRQTWHSCLCTDECYQHQALSLNNKYSIWNSMNLVGLKCSHIKLLENKLKCAHLRYRQQHL